MNYLYIHRIYQTDLLCQPSDLEQDCQGYFLIKRKRYVM